LILEQSIESKICCKVDFLKIFYDFHGFSISLIGQQRLNWEQNERLALSVKTEALIILSLKNHITSSQSRLFFNKLVGICGRSESAKSLGVVCDDLLCNDEVADRQQIYEGIADLVDLFLIARQLQHDVVVTLHSQHNKPILQG
jgi:hypothetical protein